MSAGTGGRSLATAALRAFHAAQRMAYARLAGDLVIVETSPNLPALADASGGDVRGRPVTDLFWEFVGAEEALREVAEGRMASYRLEHVNREQADGSTRYLTVQVTPLAGPGSGDGLLLLVEDTTDYGRLHRQLVQDRNELRLVRQELAAANEELQRLNQMKSLFLSMAAHDMRTPLTSIFGFADVLLSMPPADGGERRELVAIIRSQAERLHRLVDDLLSLDQIERNRLTLRYSPFDVGAGIREVTRGLGAQLALQRLRLELALPETPLIVEADAGKVTQILYNVIGNAAKYAPQGGEVRVEARRNGDEVLIRVSDNGPGMTAAEVESLFSRYYRTEEARRRGVKGSGLGLFIVKLLVEAHRGSVGVASEPDQGTTVTIRLPVEGPAG